MNLPYWIFVGAIVFFLAWIWVAYLIKIVVNDEEVQERIRRLRRRHEEERRAIEDKIKRRRREVQEFREGLNLAIHGTQEDAVAPEPDGSATEA